MYVLVSVVSWIFKALLLVFFILFLFAVFSIWWRARHRTTIHR
jgi:hypothetical protein